MLLPLVYVGQAASIDAEASDVKLRYIGLDSNIQSIFGPAAKELLHLMVVNVTGRPRKSSNRP